VLPDQRFQRILWVIGHYQIRTTELGGADLHDGHDVRVPGKAPHGALFPQEPVEVLGVEIGVQHLDGDGPIKRWRH
jgi:hypothetical protein